MAKKPGFVKLFDPENNMPIPVWTLAGKDCPAPAGMPTKVLIYGQHYRVRYHTQIYHEPKKGQLLNGVVVYNARLIVIDPAQSASELRETLFHEIGHVYLKAAQVKSETLSKVTYTQVEDICNMFAEATADLVLNNPLLK